MKHSLILGILLFISSFAQAQSQENFDSILNKIQDANWQGEFLLSVGGTTCSGPLRVRFFPMQAEDFTNGQRVLSYENHADFSKNEDLFCTQIAAALSPVKVGQCGDQFPRRFSTDTQTYVPFRTIIPQDNGTKAVVSSPSCNSQNQVERQELNLIRAVISPNENKLELTIQIEVSFIKVNVNYNLYRTQ